MANILHAVGASNDGLEVMSFPEGGSYQRLWARTLLVKDKKGEILARYSESDGKLFKDNWQELRFAHFQGSLDWPGAGVAVVTGTILP